MRQSARRAVGIGGAGAVAIGAMLALALPASAHAAVIKDRVLTKPVATAAQATGPTAQYLAGTTPVTITGDPTIAQNYANFLATLPHGAELADLRVEIVPAAEVNSACGGEDGDGILACYDSSNQTMTVPDQRIAYREGAFVPSGFYPRAGCGEMPDKPGRIPVRNGQGSGARWHRGPRPDPRS